MTVTRLISDNNKKLTITIQDKFDFSLYQSFRDSYSDFDSPNGQIVLDLHKTSYMDSSALGMILLLKEHADKLASKIVITGPNPAVLQILEIAQFQKMMTIEWSKWLQT